MTPIKRLMWIVFLTILFVPIASPAKAYLDPGTGSMILQIILGGVAGILVAAKLYWKNLLQFLGLSKGEAVSKETPSDSDRD